MAEESIEIQRIKQIKNLLEKRLSDTDEASTVFTFEEMKGDSLLSNRLAFKHTLDTIKEHTDKKISYEIAYGPQMILGGYNPRSGSVMDTFDPVPPPTIVPPQAIGYEVFVADITKLDKYFSAVIKHPIHLSEYTVKFDDHGPAIIVGERTSKLPPAQNEHLLCRVMFEETEAHVAVDWSFIYKAMTGNDPLHRGPEDVSSRKEISAHSRAVRDAMRAVNNRLKEDLNTADELFTWGNKTVTRNF